MLDPASDERYTVDYIRREAFLLIKFLRKPDAKFGDPVGVASRLSDLDARILKRWGIR